MTTQELIQQRFSGTLNNEVEYIDLLVQVFAVLIIGLILWRMIVIFHKKKNAKRKKSTYFESKWK